MQQFYIGKIFKIDNTLSAEISIFPDTQPFKNCKFFGIHSSEVKVGDQVLVLQMSKELFLYTPLKIDQYLGLKSGTSAIDLTNQGTITIKADNVIVESSNIKLGDNGSTFTPICKEDIAQILITGTTASPGQPIAATCSFPGIPSCQTVKVK